VAARGGFVSTLPDAAPALGQFWDGWGAHVDFTHPEGIAWWQRGLAAQLLDVGIHAGWNDNNEYEIWDEDAVAHGFGTPMSIARARPVQALLMTRATAEAQARHAPRERVYTVTRAGSPGIQRYAQTWTGDNTTSWTTLRWNQRMALTLSLSGLFDTGHDVGGFAGPVPDAELLVRWAQACALNPRFLMNSWKADGSVNSPWLHAQATPHVRAAILLRLALLPYLYTHRWLASVEHVPVLRPTFYDFPDDPRCHAESDEMMVGPDLLVAPVFEPGVHERELYLPADAGTPAWCELDTGRWHAAGTTVRVAAPLERLPLFVRAGAVIPTADVGDGGRLTEETRRVLRVFAAPAGHDGAERESAWVEDDGLTHAWRDGDYLRASLRTTAGAGEVRLDARRTSGHFRLPQAGIAVRLPAGDARALVAHGDGIDVPLEPA
jgi:alpha-glucosidase